MKARIIEELGQGELMLPNLVAGALKANDRAKLRMSLLQAAVHHAHEPHAAIPDFAADCGDAGIDAVTARTLVAGARIDGEGAIEAPGLSRLSEGLLSDVETMVVAVRAGDEQAGEGAALRFAALKSNVALESERVTESDIAKVTSVATDGSDSLHRLVMDLHKALNRLTAQCAEETISGARCYGLGPEDKSLVAAFMRGLERTRGLKFDHPGLDTTAVRGENRLLIQNDIGTTDAHVLVVSVTGASVTITHSDVHEPRAKFFVGLFEPFPVQWNRLRQERAEGLAKGETFYLVTGRYEAESREALEAFLEAIGAALVFLIDWNKARKALRKLVSNGDAIQILNWAARHEIGHRAFLEFGGTELIATAVRQAAPARIGFGEELGDVLGREATVKFIKSALRLSTEALRQGRSARSVRETLEVDLVRRIERNESALLATVVRQLGLARDIATAIASDIAEGCHGRTGAARHADRAKRIEEKADAIALEARRSIARTQANPTIAALVNAAEDAIDELEQASFLVSLLPRELDDSLLRPIGELCDGAIAGSEAAVRGLEAAASLSEGNGGEAADSEDALSATARLVDIEHAADGAERTVTRLVLGGDAAGQRSMAVLELARALERASDRMALVGHVLHNQVMVGLSH
jgi:uncharacterized protein Yka (UPF0111/DUF47 family)